MALSIRREALVLIAIGVVAGVRPVEAKSPKRIRCATACVYDREQRICIYWEKAQCDWWEFECVPSAKLVCENAEKKVTTVDWLPSGPEHDYVVPDNPHPEPPWHPPLE